METTYKLMIVRFLYEIISNLIIQKKPLQTWKEKMKKFNILESKLNKENEEKENDSNEEE